MESAPDNSTSPSPPGNSTPSSPPDNSTSHDRDPGMESSEEDIVSETSGYYTNLANLFNSPYLDRIKGDIEYIGEMKAEFSRQYLQKFPAYDKDAFNLINPFYGQLRCARSRIKEKFDYCKDECIRDCKGLYYYLLGKLENLLDEHGSDAIPHFEKAAKLIPNRIEVWNDLGDCYLASDNLEMAKNCFHEALQREKNSWSLRSLSVLCRKEACNDGCDMKVAVNLGVKYAKKALEINPADSYSWMILGNAYMAHFLLSKDELNFPVKALQAYAQAEKNNGQFQELFFNKAIALLYCEDYSGCLKSLEEAIKRDPIWVPAWEKYFSIIEYIQSIAAFTFTKGRLRGKKINQMVHSLNRESTVAHCTKFSYITVNALTDGINYGKVIMGKVLWSCELEDDGFPFTFGIVDGLNGMAVVTIYNLTTGKGIKIGDTVAILNPKYSTHSCSIGIKVYGFQKIRIDSPKDFTVNDQCLPDSHCGRSLAFTKCE